MTLGSIAFLVEPFLLPLNTYFGAFLCVFFFRSFPQQQSAEIGHHVSVPPSLISSLCVLNVLVKPFTLLFTIGPQVFGEVVNVWMQEMHFKAHITTLWFESIQHPIYNIFVVGIPPVPQEFEHNIFEGVPGFFLFFWHRLSDLQHKSYTLCAGPTVCLDCLTINRNRRSILS